MSPHWFRSSALYLLFAPVPVLAQANPTVIRLATVPVPVTSGLLNTLLPDFQRATGYRVQVLVQAQDIYQFARTGAADLVISHYGFDGLDTFVLAGLGMWPKPVFASQSVIIGPTADPAKIRGLQDAVEGFRRIAAAQLPFIANNDPNVQYATGVLWEGAGNPDRAGWYSDVGLEGSNAIESAALLGGYTMWGVDPFLQYQQTHHLPLEILISADPFLQRVMAATVVTTKTTPDANVNGAVALREYLVSPAVQARIRAFRYPGIDTQFWWPSGQNNDAAPCRGGPPTCPAGRPVHRPLL
jgi:tungstate transport system substrate-binding protein